MFAVVGCSDCEALWVVEGRPETTACSRCGTRRQFAKLKKFAETESADAARNVRSVMRQRRADADGDIDDFATLGEHAMDAGVDDETYLTASGIDPDAVAAAGKRADGDGHSLSKREAVEAAVRELDRPTEAEVAAFAADHGVDGEYAEWALRKLERAGKVTTTDGRYRPL